MDLNEFTYMAFVTYRGQTTPVFNGMSHVQARRLLSNVLKGYGFDEQATLPTVRDTYNKWDRSDGVIVTVIANQAVGYDKAVSPLQRFRARVLNAILPIDVNEKRRSLNYMAEQSGLEWRGEEGREIRKEIQEHIDG